MDARPGSGLARRTDGLTDRRTVTAFLAVPGKGVRGEADGHLVLAGNAALLEANGVDPAELRLVAAELAGKARTPVMVAIDGRAVAVLGISDPVRAESRAAVAELRAMGLHVVMLTGDDRATAQAVAGDVGIDEVIAEVMPAEKQAAISRLREQGRVVAMVGDGINDAPALALADVGIAIGTGTDVAVEAADVTLLQPDLRGVARTLQLCRRTMRVIRQNLFWAFAYNAVGVVFAATGWLHPALAAAAMVASSGFVVANSLSLAAGDVGPNANDNKVADKIPVHVPEHSAALSQVEAAADA